MQWWIQWPRGQKGSELRARRPLPPPNKSGILWRAHLCIGALSMCLTRTREPSLCLFAAAEWVVVSQRSDFWFRSVKRQTGPDVGLGHFLIESCSWSGITRRGDSAAVINRGDASISLRQRRASLLGCAARSVLSVCACVVQNGRKPQILVHPRDQVLFIHVKYSCHSGSARMLYVSVEVRCVDSSGK